MLAATERADESVQRRAGPFAFSLFAIGALTHFFVGPSAAGFGGGGTNP